MIYVISDIHGCYDKYQTMLEKINPDTNDTIYVLGDIIDRGADGFKTMLDIMSQPNVYAIRGNHEAMAINAMIKFAEEAKKNHRTGTIPFSNDMNLWFRNGGEISLAQFMTLSQEDAYSVWTYMLTMPLYKEISVEGKEYILVHGGLGNFSTNRSLNNYSVDEIVWSRPTPDTRYYSDKTVIVGHTPTFYYNSCSMNNASIYRTDSFIDIDCGCVYGGRLACLCLDTNEEIYL